MNPLLFDPHVHTKEVSSCGKVPAREMVKRYARAGFTGICITDHYYPKLFSRQSHLSWDQSIDAYLSGYEEAFYTATANPNPFHVLLGMELSFSHSPEDYLVYGIDRQFLIDYPKLYDYSLAAFRKLADDNGLLIIQAHPFRPGLHPASPTFIHGMEVYNGNPRHDSHNDLALAYAKKHHLIQIACSDAHQVEDIGQGATYITEPLTTSAALVDWLCKHPTPSLKQGLKQGTELS